MIDHTDAGDVPSNGAPEVLHYLQDALGNVVALTNTNTDGDVVERYDYDPYGGTYIERPLVGTNGWSPADEQGNRILASRYGNPFLWTGQRRDATTGQYHFWARTYSPHLGRWLQRDPLEYLDGIDLYLFGLNSPTSSVDPLGLWTVWVHHRIIQELAKRAKLPKDVESILIKASDEQDSKRPETPPYQHGMRSPDETVEEAKQKAKEWEESVLATAALFREGFDIQIGGMTIRIQSEAAYWYFIGQLLHYLSDMYSPAHVGWQEWKGYPDTGPNGQSIPGRETTASMAIHGGKESFIDDDVLNKILEDLIQYLKDHGCVE